MRNNFYMGKNWLLFFAFQASPQGTNISKMLNNFSVKAEAHFLLSKPGNSSPFLQGQEAERPGPFLLLSEDEPAGMENGLVMRQGDAEATGQASISDSGS